MSLRNLFQSSPKTPDVSVGDLASRPASMRVIDVREPYEFIGELGHIAGAELVPLATIEEASATWDRGHPIVVICRSGRRSARAAYVLSRLGFRDVVNAAGGMLAWNAAGLPIERGG